MDKQNRSGILSSLLAAASIAIVSACTAQRSQGREAGPDKQTVLNAVKTAIAGKTKEELLAELDEKAGYYFKLSGNCAQTTFLALRDVFDLPDGGISRALSGFPGLGLRGETCGTVSGSLMALGIAYGPDDLEDFPAMMGAVLASAQVCEGVVAAMGSTQCGDILKAATGRQFDFTRKEDWAAYSASDAPMACYKVVITATHLAAELLMQATA